MTRSRPHLENERQWSVNNIWSCIFGNQGFARIHEHISELLTAFIVKNTLYDQKNRDSRIITIADCETCKERVLAVEYQLFIIYYNPTAKTITLYKSTDGHAGRPADNPLHSNGLWDFHRTVPELTVQVYWKLRAAICQLFGFNLDPDLKWRSGPVVNVAPKSLGHGLQVHLQPRLIITSKPILTPGDSPLVLIRKSPQWVPDW